MSCPRCAAGMYVGKTPAGGDMWGCGQCGGVWLDNATAQHVVDSVCEATLGMARSAAEAAAVPSRPAAQGLKCPACGQNMKATKVQAAWLDIDVCDAHGTWYDHGELEKVARATKRDVGDWRSQPKPAPPMTMNPQPPSQGGGYMDDGTSEVVAEVAIEAGGWAVFALIEALFD